MDLSMANYDAGRLAVEKGAYEESLKHFAAALAINEPWLKEGKLKGTLYAGQTNALNYWQAHVKLILACADDIELAFHEPRDKKRLHHPRITMKLLLHRGRLLAVRKNMDEAVATAERSAALKLPVDTVGECLFNAARIRGFLAQVADGDDRTSHAAAALKHLAAARNRGYFDVPGKVTELFQADFTGLRDHADFAKLKKDIEDDAGVLVLSKQGALRADDPRDPVLKKSPHHVFEVKMTAGKRYAIHLARTGQRGFDPFLRLENSAGKELASDDDSGGDQDAFLVFVPQETGTYRVVATSYNGVPGTYDLTLRERAKK